jgi:pimeloyl-ACP methyl ester carboxylesterase/DNA-binding SARP family transcriptional activator
MVGPCVRAVVVAQVAGCCVPDRALPETRFARTSGGSSIAYQCVGDGDVSIVSVPPMAQNIEMAWEWPAIRQMFEGFATFCRFLPFDKRGTGMSNRSLDIPRLDERVDELSAVLDHAGLDHTYLMGTSEGGPMTLMFAATYPERVQGVILESTAAWLAPGAGEDDDQVAGRGSTGMWERFVEGWGTSESITVDLFAPSLIGDGEFRRWHERYERNAASRDAIAVLLDLAGEMDARGVLHRVECPILILHRLGDRIVPIEAARETCGLLRSHGVEVELVEMPGEDHLLYATDLALALGAIERFTTGKVSDRTRTWGSHRTDIITMSRFDVVVDGTSVPTSAWGSRRARTLLKRLVVARGQPVTRDELIELLWPEGRGVDRLGARLSVQLCAVRRILRGGVIADRSSVRLDLDHVDVDLERWFALTDDAAVVAAFHGELLPEDRYEDWSAPVREEVRARFAAAVRRLADVSDANDAIELWRRLLRQDPYDEAAHRSVISTLRAKGRLSEARAAYQTYVAAMDDLGVDSVTWDGLVR